MFQSENESNDEDYARSPVLLDLDENSKQQQQKAALREANSPNAASAVQDQRLQNQLTASAPGGSCVGKKIILTRRLNFAQSVWRVLRVIINQISSSRDCLRFWYFGDVQRSARRGQSLTALLVAADETTIALTTRSQPLRGGRWQETTYESARHQNPEGVLVIRVPEPEIIGSHSQLEMLHETNIKSMQQEPSQTEKGAAISNCASPGEITSSIRLI